MNIGFHITRLNYLIRELQKKSAGMKDKQEVYFLATEICLEANHIREMLDHQEDKNEGVFNKLFKGYWWWR